MSLCGDSVSKYGTVSCAIVVLRACDEVEPAYVQKHPPPLYQISCGYEYSHLKKIKTRLGPHWRVFNRNPQRPEDSTFDT